MAKRIKTKISVGPCVEAYKAEKTDPSHWIDVLILLA